MGAAADRRVAGMPGLRLGAEEAANRLALPPTLRSSSAARPGGLRATSDSAAPTTGPVTAGSLQNTARARSNVSTPSRAWDVRSARGDGATLFS